MLLYSVYSRYVNDIHYTVYNVHCTLYNNMFINNYSVYTIYSILKCVNFM